MKIYTVGFIFDPSMASVLLIQKNHPSAHAGKWNGVGGHVDNGESVIECMNREAKEELGWDVTWKLLGTMGGSTPEPWSCAVFKGFAPFRHLPAKNDVGERVQIFSVWRLPSEMLGNTEYLIKMALDRAQPTFTMHYDGNPLDG